MSNETFFLQAWFSGRVQGVGFRYQTLQTAKEFEVRGEVENLADGRVLLQAEGEEAEVQSFLEAVQERMDNFIRDTETRTTHRPAQYHGFVITS